MKTATFIMSALSFAASVSTLLVMAHTAKKVDDTAEKVKADVETFKDKTNRNLVRIKTTLSQLEM